MQKQKKKNEENQNLKKNRFLITVNVLGSSGPIKFVVNENDRVAVVIDSALKLYAREGRLPVLGSNVIDFLLHPTNAGSEGNYYCDQFFSSSSSSSIYVKKVQYIFFFFNFLINILLVSNRNESDRIVLII